MSGIGASSGGLNAGIGGRPVVLRGRYRIKRLLGRGGMGAVFLATDALFGDQPCAVKELLGDPAATPAEAAEAEERFAREARLLATLEHPNLPKVRDYFSEQGQSYLVMDYIDGETVEQRVAREGPQSQQAVLGWAQELCAALEYLHAQMPPIIFRDVAPDNIMIDSSGLLIFAVMPTLQFAWTSIFATTSLAGGDAILYFCQLPHLALLAIVLCYFQGRSVRAQRLTTAGVFLCGLGMVVGAPGLYAAMFGWMVARGWLSVNLAVYGPIWATLLGMNLVAGSLVMAGSARRLRMLSGGQAVLPELRADARAALASATATLRRRPAALPPGKAN